MPIFEYKCRQCGNKFEALARSSKSDATCNNCGSKKVTQLLSVFAIAGTSGATSAVEAGPCGACGAPRRGMCGE